MVLGEARITEEGLSDLRSRLGKIYDVTPNREAVTLDAIRRFADGIGDRNPLWTDPSYAAETRFKTNIAPPTFLFSVFLCSGNTVGGLPGVHGFFGGAEWEWSRRIYLDDVISVTFRPADVIEKESSFAQRTVIVYGEAHYYTHRGELIARTRGWTIRAERKAARERGKYSAIKKALYTPEELAAIYEAQRKEQRRGGAPRYWEDVREGEELPPVVKGPLGIEEMVNYRGACHSGESHVFRLRHMRRHPAWGFRDPRTGGLQSIGQVHEQDVAAGGAGIPSAYDLGPQRICWLGHLVTSWMGDDGFLKKMYAEIRRFNMFGDTQWIKGKVARKYLHDGERLVDLDIWAENQRKEVTAPGRATVWLPSLDVSTLPFHK